MYCHDCAAPVPMGLQEYAKTLDRHGAVHCPHCQSQHMPKIQDSRELLKRVYT